MPEYTVRKVKTFRGREGTGFNAELCCDGKPVALVMNQADGGSFRFEWNDRGQRVPVELVSEHSGQVRLFYLLSDEAKLHEFCKGKTQTYTFTLKGAAETETLPLTPDMLVTNLVDDYTLAQSMRRACTKSTCFKLKGQKDGAYMTVPFIFTSEIAAGLRKQYGEKLEVIYNEKYAGG